jgi:glycosyltransferase involved in cell wall biosynthesis
MNRYGQFGQGKRVLMLLENATFKNDTRVRRESAALREAGFDVTCICPAPKNATSMRDEHEGVPLHYFKTAPEMSGVLGYFVEYGWAVTIMALLTLRVWLTRGFDVLHAHNPPDFFFWLGAIAKIFGKKFVFDHHDLGAEMYAARCENGTGRKDGSAPNGLLMKALRFCEVATVKTANRVISTNESYKKLAMARSGKSGDAFSIVRNGPDPDLFAPMPPNAELRARAKTLIGYVGAMGPQDGIDYLIRALKHLKFDLGRDDFLAVIVGSGETLDELRAYSKELGIEKHVWFTGRVSLEDLLSYLSTVDICADPDPKNAFTDRSTMIKMLEYMTLSKPIVAFDLTEHRVSAGASALYAAPNDELDFARKIAELADDPVRGAQMGAAGRERVLSQLAWKHQRAHLLDCYARLLEVAPVSSEAQPSVRQANGG